MHDRYVKGITIRLLRNGDTAAVESLLDRLGPQSRARRFGGAKPRLSDSELEALARVDSTHHVLVAYVEGDPEPAGMAHLVRESSSGEVAYAVADDYQGRGIGTALAAQLAADARAARIVELHATVVGDNPRAISLLARCAQALHVRWRGGEREVVARLDRTGPPSEAARAPAAL
jgi:GNAT superfamily N-acetyltransferase